MEHGSLSAVKRKSSSWSDIGADCKLLKIETTINQLPDDILFEIFKYISPVQLHFSVSTVSNRWQAICSHPSLWRKIYINSGTESSTVKVCGLLKALSCKTNEIYIANRNDCDTILTQVFRFNKNLSLLSLTHCGGMPFTTYISSRIIKNVILKLPKLRSLHLYDTTFRSVKFFEIFGSQKFMLLRSKELGNQNDTAKNHPITYTGVLTYKQLEAYTKNLNTSGKITLNNGKEYSIRRVREILESSSFDPNSIVRTLENSTSS